MIELPPPVSDIELRPVGPMIYTADCWCPTRAQEVADWARSQRKRWVDWRNPQTALIKQIKDTHEGVDVATFVKKRRYSDLPFGNVVGAAKEWRRWANEHLYAELCTWNLHPHRWQVPFIPVYDAGDKGSKTCTPLHSDGFASVVITVQAPKRGGGLHFPNLGLTIPDKVGQIIVFPGRDHFPDPRLGAKWMQHTSLPVTEGCRMTLIAFFEAVAA